MTYSLQRYEGGNFAALQAVPDGHRKVASVSAAHEFDLSRRWTVGYGARYEHYDYLDGYGLVSPSVRAVFAPVPRLRLHAKASRQQVAPGAEEFVPPADAQWVPPQRTFAPIGDAPLLDRERAAIRSRRDAPVPRRRRLACAPSGRRSRTSSSRCSAPPIRPGWSPPAGTTAWPWPATPRCRAGPSASTHDLSPHVRGSVDYALVVRRVGAAVGGRPPRARGVAPRALRAAARTAARPHDLARGRDAADGDAGLRALQAELGIRRRPARRCRAPTAASTCSCARGCRS